jgi:predicted nucleic acid-binding Zn ribbon protein
MRPPSPRGPAMNIEQRTWLASVLTTYKCPSVEWAAHGHPRGGQSRMGACEWPTVLHWTTPPLPGKREGDRAAEKARSLTNMLCASPAILQWLFLAGGWLVRKRASCPRIDGGPKHDWHYTSSDSESERAALVTPGGGVVGSRGRCTVCGARLRGRQRSDCSDRCRAAKSPRRRTEAQTERDQRVRELLDAALRMVVCENHSTREAGAIMVPFAPDLTTRRRRAS